VRLTTPTNVDVTKEWNHTSTLQCTFTPCKIIASPSEVSVKWKFLSLGVTGIVSFRIFLAWRVLVERSHGLTMAPSGHWSGLIEEYLGTPNS
jgi:hypothetical protein